MNTTPNDQDRQALWGPGFDATGMPGVGIPQLHRDLNDRQEQQGWSLYWANRSNRLANHTTNPSTIMGELDHACTANPKTIPAAVYALRHTPVFSPEFLGRMNAVMDQAVAKMGPLAEKIIVPVGDACAVRGRPHTLADLFLMTGRVLDPTEVVPQPTCADSLTRPSTAIMLALWTIRNAAAHAASGDPDSTSVFSRLVAAYPSLTQWVDPDGNNFAHWVAFPLSIGTGVDFLMNSMNSMNSVLEAHPPWARAANTLGHRPIDIVGNGCERHPVLGPWVAMSRTRAALEDCVSNTTKKTAPQHKM